MNKKLVASLFLYEKEAITSFDNLTVVSKDAVTLAKMYSDKHADELLVFDLSMGDKEHEEALDVIKAICENIEIPVIEESALIVFEEAAFKKAISKCTLMRKKGINVEMILKDTEKSKEDYAAYAVSNHINKVEFIEE